MIKLETGYFLNDVEILLGDKLKGEKTDEVVVLSDNENEKIVAQVINQPETYFDLEQFLLNWNDLKVTGSVLTRPEK